ncbi:hypothetical protein PAMP_011822 [Pampus punctatissimus]
MVEQTTTLWMPLSLLWRLKRPVSQHESANICQKQEIKRLQDEQEELLRSLRVSQSLSNRQNDASVVQELTAMLACEDRIDKELREEKGKVASLKDQGSKRFNQLMTRNGQLREDLKILQEDKKQFLHIKSQLENELHAIHKDVCKLRTKCTEAFSTSGKIKEKHRMLSDHNAKEVAQFMKENSKLEREISHYSNCEAFLGMKATARINQDVDHRKGDLEQRKQLEFKECGMEDFEDAIKTILRETGERDPEELVRKFIQMEEQNYTLLIFVNHQHNETQAIQRQISQLCNEMDIFVAENQRQLEQHRALQRTIFIKREAVEQQLAVYQQRVGFMEKLLDQLKKGVKSLLHISYDSSEICNKLSSFDGVQDENITEYLRMVEDRTNKLLTLQSYLLFQESLDQWDTDSAIAGQLLGIKPSAVSLTTAASTPAPDDDPDSVESVLLEMKVPMSREDLLTLVNKRVQRKKTD